MSLRAQQRQAKKRQANDDNDGFQLRDDHDKNSDATTTTTTAAVTIDQVVELVGYLQDTCQLVPDAQVVATTRKYPLQEYQVGTPEQLVDRHRWVKKKNDDGKKEEEQQPNIDCSALAAILRSKSVCAWGECYHKKKFVV